MTSRASGHVSGFGKNYAVMKNVGGFKVLFLQIDALNAG